MAVKFTNNAKTTLSGSLSNSATSTTVADGSVFPTLTGAEYFYATLFDGTNNEVVKVTARSSNDLTIVRAQDNTSARAFSSGDSVELRVTAALLSDLVNPAPLATVATTVTITDNESTSESNNIVFVADAGGSTGTHALEFDGDLAYNPNTGTLTTAYFSGSGLHLSALNASNIASGSIAAARIANDTIDSQHYADGSIDTAHIADNQVTLAKMAGLARGKIIYGDASGDPAALAAGSANYVLTSDGTDISWASSGSMSSFQLEDDDGTEVAISDAKEVKFIGSGITTNWTDTSTGSDGDPYDLTFTVDAAQTGITSIYATDLIIGEDSQTAIDFGTANEIDFKADNAARLTLTASALYPVTDNQIDLGTSSLEFKDAFFDGTVTADAFAGPLTGDATGLTGTPNITVGTISSGNTTTTGYLRGPASFTIDPATHGDDTGTVVIAGNLQVDGTTTTINSTTVAIDDLNFSIATDAADSAAANGAGITIGGASATLLYTHATTSWDMNKPLNVTGVVTANAGVVVDNITIDGNTISTTNSNGNLIITPNGTGNVNVNTDVFAIQGTEGETASLALQCDESDDAGDEWRFTTNTNQTLSIKSNISGSEVDQITLTPNSTVASSTTAIAGGATVGGTLAVTGKTTGTAATNVSGLEIGGGTASQSYGKIHLSGAGTAVDHIRISNDGGHTLCGTERNTGGGLAGSTLGYASVFGSIGATAAHIMTNNTTKMTVLSDGKVGIGTTAPADELELKGDGYRFRVSSADEMLASLGNWGNSGADIDEGFLSLYSSGTETIRIASNADSFLNGGKILIGDTASHTTDLLQIETPASGGGHGIQIRRNDSNTDQGVGHILFGNNTATDLASISAKTDGATDNGAILFNTSATGGSLTERMRVANDGTIGIGCTPDAWHADYSAIQFANGTLVNDAAAGASKSLTLAHNAYIDSGNAWTYINADEASYYQQYNGAHYFATAAAGSADADITFAVKMTVLSDGKVGIGETAPHGNLHVKSADSGATADGGADELVVEGSGNAGISILSGASSSGAIYFGDSGSAYDGYIQYDQANRRFNIVTATSGGLMVDANSRIAYNSSSGANGHGNFVGEVGANSKAIAFEHTNGGGEVGTIVTGSSSTTYNTSSDYRLKENVDYSWDATTRLKQLKPARFNWIADETNALQDGFLAHEVSSVVPEAITGEKDAEEMQQIDQSKLVPLLVKTIQELEARIVALEGA